MNPKFFCRAIGLWAIVVLTVFVVKGWNASGDDRTHKSLYSLSDAYQDVDVVMAEMVQRVPPGKQLMQIASRQDGELAARYWPIDTSWKDVDKAGQKPSYFVFSNGGELYTKSAGSPHYTSFEYGLDLSEPNTLNVHHFLAPWPYISQWSRLLLDSSDVVYTNEGELHTASSQTLGLSLTWNDRLDVIRILQERVGGSVTTITFDDFQMRRRVNLPTTVRLRASASAASDAVFREVEHTYTEMRESENFDETLLVFDPVALGVYRYEASTGNVYNHDGSLFYNEHAFLKQAGIPTAGTRISTPWYVLLIVAGVGSGWLAYREVRAGRLAGPGESWLTCAIAGGRVLVGLFLLLAVVAKMSTITYVGGDPAHGMASFAAVIERHGVIPSMLVAPAAYLAIGLELLLGVALLAHRRVRLIASTALGFIALLSTYLGLVWMMRGNVSCGCLGTLTSDQLSSSLVRNLVTACLLAPSVIWKSR